ncbi:hypothetical protein CDAR_197211 [Caerostris darwini]|uniref:Uncharacterized protein n=1 Tax=Caerostris darwini TaxID=1538125 RepID=A0AAV4M7T8_9ARAC|nr:hypothetical protein CDAR_197211 [Caerostris darwini]
MLVSVLIGLCILNKFSSSMNILTTQEIESLNVTDVPLANISKGLSTNFSSEISDSLPTKDEAIQSSNVTTVESAKKSKDSNRFTLKDRSRRQQFLYPQTRYIPPNYVAPGLFDLCPPLGTNCPVCFKESTKLSNTFCSGSYIALKVIVLSPPQSDTSGRVCGKLGLLKVLGVGLESSLNAKDFRKLLRFSIDESCGCTLAVSKIYYVIAHLSIFLKEGLLINKIILTDQAILLSNDLYVEREIIHHFSRCYHPESAYIPSSIDDPYRVPSVPPILPPRVEPVQVTDDPLAPPEPILPHVADPYKVSPISPEATAVDPYQIAAVSPEPQVLQPIPPDVPVMPPIAEPVPLQPYVSPPAEVQVPPALPILPIEDAQSHPAPPPEPIMPRSYLNPYATDVSHIRKSILPGIYPLTGTNYLNKLLHGPVLTTCLLPETCPKCYRIEDVMDIAPPYCGSNFAFIAVIRIPDSSSIQAESTSYAAQNCMSLFTNIVYDVTMNKDAKVMVNTLKALLPVQCLMECFKGVKGRVIAMILGPVPIVAPASQLDANIMLFILPAPSTIVLPTCSQYYPGYLSTYSLRLEGPQQYSSSSCPDSVECPVCQPEPDNTIFSYACEYGFASIVEMDFSEPTLISQQLPSISVKKIATYYQVIDEIVISHPPSNQCVKATFKVVQNLGHFPLNFPGYKILFLSLPNCGCLTQGYQRLLVFSSKAAELSQAGTLHLTKDIYVSPLSAQDPTPTCQQPHNPIPFVQPTSPPPPPAYPTYVPQSHPYPYYERTPRVALTYIPPSPPPPSYIPLSSPPPLHYLSYPGYMPGSVHESAYPPASLPPISSSQNETAYVPPQSANELSTSDPNLVLPAISSSPDYPPPVDPAYPSSSINDPRPNVAIPVSTSPIAVHSLSTSAYEQLPSTNTKLSNHSTENYERISRLILQISICFDCSSWNRFQNSLAGTKKILRNCISSNQIRISLELIMRKACVFLIYLLLLHEIKLWKEDIVILI